MGELFGFIWCAIAGLFGSRAALQAEILVLRHQGNILHRRSPKRVALGKIDRLVFCGLYRLFPTVLYGLKILQPKTVISKTSAMPYWRWRSRRRSGRRQLEGIAKAKAEGKYEGRKPSVGIAEVRRLKAEGLGATEIAERLGIGRASVYRVPDETK
jgi:hypothetical protein